MARYALPPGVAGPRADRSEIIGTTSKCLTKSSPKHGRRWPNANLVIIQPPEVAADGNHQPALVDQIESLLGRHGLAVLADLGKDLRQLGIDLLRECEFFVADGHGHHFFAQRTRRSVPEIGTVPVAFAKDFGPLGDEPLMTVLRKFVQVGAESLDDLRDLLRVAPDGQTEVVGYRA